MNEWGSAKADGATLQRLAKVQWLLTDCDGCLTDGGVYYGEAGEALKRFSIIDGMGVVRLRAAGVSVGIVTGERSPSIVARAQKLAITELHLGVGDKAKCLREFCSRWGVAPEAIAYFGDDVNDLPVLPQVGFFAAPANAVPEVLAAAHWVSPRVGGHGAFRDLAELVLRARS